MARPIKQGLDYFPFDITLLSDRKFRRAKQKYGFTAVGVYLSLLKIAYRDEGYYIDYSDNKKDDVIWEIQEDLAGRYQPSAEVVENVIELLVASELFSVDHFNNKIITSKRIQSNYYTAKAKSVITTINTNVWMLSIKEMEALGKNNPILQFFINTELTRVNSEITRVNTEITPQSKVNKSIVKKNVSKEKSSQPTNEEATKTHNIMQLYNTTCTNLAKCTKLTPKRSQQIINCKYSENELKNIFEKANQSDFLAGKNKYGFIANIDWVLNENNIVKIREGVFDNPKSTSNSSATPLSDRHSYSKEELDNLFNKEDESVFDF